ncbi:hypothetical protein [Cohnella sp. WQ 127256]|uniref:hypothetical protein n=1 Tax=Cohnella sp. WQ 127256 TaxID=2938790 RepID=UPI002118D4DE|nr:hypothetical protein [Cohnella sp. WQ 127256]
MDSLFPINEDSLRPLVGRAVYVIMNDDTRHTGVLTSCSSSSIILNGERTARPVNRSRKSKMKVDINSLELDQRDRDAQPASSAYWGALSLEPAKDISTVKAVIPLAPIRAVILI